MFLQKLKELSMTMNNTAYLSCLFCVRPCTSVRWTFLPLLLACDGAQVSFNKADSLSSTSDNYCPRLKKAHRPLIPTASGVWNTYRTMVLRNQGLLAMEGTASSIRGCILMKLSVSSGNSLDTLYFSMGGVPAQLPGLQIEGRRRRVMRSSNDKGEKISSRWR